VHTIVFTTGFQKKAGVLGVAGIPCPGSCERNGWSWGWVELGVGIGIGMSWVESGV